MPLSALRQRIFALAEKNLTPLDCVFELTYRCNLRCNFCYIISRKEKELNTKKVFFILEQLKKAGCLYLTFSGGEIFLRKDFFAIAEYARYLNFALRLYTNGTLIDVNSASRIKTLKPLVVEISLLGFENTHDKITAVKGSFRRALRAVMLLKDRGVPVRLKITLEKDNIAEVWALQDFIKRRLGVEWREVGGNTNLTPCDNGDRRPLGYEASDGQLRDYLRKELIKRQDERLFFRPKRVKGSSKLCGAAFTTCNVTPYGELNPCLQIRLKDNRIAGNNLLKLWRTHKIFNALRELRKRDAKQCMRCSNLPYCFRCPGVAFLETGSFTAPVVSSCREAGIRKELYDTT